MSSILGRWSRAWFRRSSLANRPLPRRFLPAVETLEGRVNPAGIVTTSFSLGTLTISAADDVTAIPGLNNQDIFILGTGAGSFNLTPLGGETFVGGTSFSNVKNIRLLMRLGNDVVTVTSANLTGTLTFLGGSGNNNLQIDGNNTIGNVSITNGNGNDQFEFANGTNLITGNVIINNGQGDSEARFGIAGADVTTVNGKVSVTNGDGFDIFDFNATLVSINGPVTIKNGSGGSNTSFDAGANTIGGALNITSGDGFDPIEFGGNTVDLRSVKIHNGSGDGNVAINSTTTTIAGNLSFTSTAGNADFDVNGDAFSITGTTTITMGSGTNQVFLDAAVTNDFDGPIKVSTGAGGELAHFGSIGGTSSFRNISVDMGTGDNTGINVAGFFGASTVTGNVTVTSGDGPSNFEVGGLLFDVSGTVTINSGAGGSGIQFDAATQTLASLKVTNGDGFDTFNVNNSFTVTGNTTISHGHGGSFTNLDGSGTNLNGKLTIKALDGVDSVLLRDATVTLATVLNLGNGNDVVDIHDSIFNGAVTVTTGNGSDIINIATQDLGATTVFNKPVTINTGAGDDFLTIGGDVNDFADFNAAPVKLIGGLDLDSIVAESSGFNQFFSPPIESGWEQGT